MGQCCPKKTYVSFEEDEHNLDQPPTSTSSSASPPSVTSSSSSSSEYSSTTSSASASSSSVTTSSSTSSSSKSTSSSSPNRPSIEIVSHPVPLISHVKIASAETKPAPAGSQKVEDKTPSKPAPPKGPTPEEVAKMAARHELEAVAARFELPTFDVTEDPERILLKLGTLTRQARFKTVKRVCVLCNDVFIFANLMDNDEYGGKLQMKQVIELSTATLDDRTGGKTRMKNAVCINSPTRDFVISASSAAEREEWMRLLAQQIVKCQGLPRILQNAADDDEDAPPVALPRTEKKDDPAAASLHSVLRGTLHSFTLMGELDNMRLLIKQKKDLDVNSVDSEGATALHVAAEARSVAACEILLEARGDPTLLNQHGQNVLHIACVKGEPAIAKLLLASEAALSQGFFPQCTAAGVDKQGNTPLFLVTTRCEKPARVPQIIDILVTAGADAKAKTYSEGRTLLHVVAQSGLAAAVAPLLSHGASLSALCTAGRAPLHYASAADCMDTCMALINQGAPPNRRDKQGNTPLHLAPSLQMAYYLISVGAQPDLTNTQEVSALQRFQDHKDASVLATVNRCVSMFHDSPNVVLTEALPPVTSESAKASACTLCQGTFTLTSLRHSCKKCGSQVCGKCSSKKVTLNTGGPPPPPARQAIDAMANVAKMAQLPTWGLLSTELRVCDACYNYLRCKESVSAAAHVESEETTESTKPAPPSKPEEAKIPRTWQDDVNDTLSLAQQNKAILENNLQKLGEMETRAQNLQDSGKDFFEAAHALANKQRKK